MNGGEEEKRKRIKISILRFERDHLLRDREIMKTKLLTRKSEDNFRENKMGKTMTNKH